MDDMDVDDTFGIADATEASIIENVNISDDNVTDSYYVWYADSATMSHITHQKEILSDFCPEMEIINGVGAIKIYVHGRGTIILESRIMNRTWRIVLTDIFYVPTATSNLISIPHLDQSGYTSRMGNSNIRIYNSQYTLVAVGKLTNRLYKLIVKPKIAEHTYVSEKQLPTWNDWHKHYGHINILSLQYLQQHRMINNLRVNPLREVIPCDACHAGKLSIKSFKQRHNITTTKPGQWTHTDLWGPSSTTSIGGAKYYLLCVDDYSCYVTIAHLKSKDQAAWTIKQYLTFLKNQYAFQPCALHMDNGKEYVNAELIDWCWDNGICLELTAPYSPQQNGVAEHANRTLVELMRTMLSAQNLLFHLWMMAVSHAAYLCNWAYTKAIPNAMPYEWWFGKKPSVNHLVEYGAPVWILRQPMVQSKLVPKALKHKFVRFEDSISTIRYWDQ